MIKIEVIYKDADQAPEYFEVDGENTTWSIIEEGLFEYRSKEPVKFLLIPISNILRIEGEVVKNDV